MHDWRRWHGFALATAFIPGIVGAATAPRWLVATFLLPQLGLGAGIFAVVCWFKLAPEFAMQWTIVAAAFSWGRKLDDITPWLTAFAAGVGVSAALALLELGGLFVVEAAARPAGLFVNKNVLGITAAITLVACLIHHRWALAWVMVPAIVASGSRTAWLAAAIGSLILLPWRWRLLCLASLASLLWLNHDSTSLGQRWELWGEAFKALTVAGTGSWHYAGRLGTSDYLHNDWLQLLVELGVVGLLPIGALALLARTELALAATVFIAGLFDFPLHMPASGVLVGIVCGHHLARHAAGSRIPLRERLAYRLGQ